MAAARAQYQEFADLPAYTGSGQPIEARKTVAALTKLPSEDYIRSLDKDVEACLPPGCLLEGIEPHGSAYWTRTAAISAILNDSSLKFFLKLTRTNVGLTNLIGEYTSMKAIHVAVPGFSPNPLAVGTYDSDPNVHFYLSSYVEMTDEVATVDKLPAKLAELHSKALSPDGRFGFPVPTCMGACVQSNSWTSSWEMCFSRLLNVMFEFEQDIHGENQEMQNMHEHILTKVIPRLLRPLETEGRSIPACFVHGDLWDGNTSMDATTGGPIIFDASGSYAHSEYELGAWNQPRHKIYRSYIEEYLRYMPPSAPEEDFEDRLILYRLRFNLTSSACYLENLRFRELCIEDMRYLTTRYKEGYQGPAQAKDRDGP